ncbi:exostosin family protein [Actinidia rufa]|uniref:Exostosin family protein n=1 Tax=Actinidia rufa TaxID=165716 RepID=A0A7J0ECN4_9ERIC|nr:exostosin family protein [Actinidia rufa]
MAGKHYSGGSSRNRSPIILFVFSLLALSVLVYVFSVFSSPSPSPSHSLPIHTSQYPNRNPSPKADYSFVASLEKFLSSTSKLQRSRTVWDDTVASVSVEAVKTLDDKIWKTETERLCGNSFFPAFSSSVPSPLRVYVYDMPRKFTYDLLWLFQNTYRETSNLTSNGSPVHPSSNNLFANFARRCKDFFMNNDIYKHSIDYWLWADLIAPESKRLLKNVVRVHRQEEADLFYIPFFTTISFFLLEKQQCKALYRV